MNLMQKAHHLAREEPKDQEETSHIPLGGMRGKKHCATQFFMCGKKNCSVGSFET